MLMEKHSLHTVIVDFFSLYFSEFLSIFHPRFSGFFWFSFNFSEFLIKFKIEKISEELKKNICFFIYLELLMSSPGK